MPVMCSVILLVWLFCVRITCQMRKAMSHVFSYFHCNVVHEFTYSSLTIVTSCYTHTILPVIFLVNIGFTVKSLILAALIFTVQYYYIILALIIFVFLLAGLSNTLK